MIQPTEQSVHPTLRIVVGYKRKQLDKPREQYATQNLKLHKCCKPLISLVIPHRNSFGRFFRGVSLHGFKLYRAWVLAVWDRKVCADAYKCDDRKCCYAFVCFSRISIASVSCVALSNIPTGTTLEPLVQQYCTQLSVVLIV